MTNSPRPRNLAPLALVLIVGLAGFVLFRGRNTDDSPSTASVADGDPIVITPGDCSKDIDRARLDESLDLGIKFLLAHQQEEGNFDYEYDWVKQTYTPGDSQVRQAGAAWGLALIYHNEPREDVGAALDRALAFFERHSATTDDGARYIRYPGDKVGSLGTVALVALTHIDYLRGGKDVLPADRQEKLRTHLDEYIKFLLSARQDGGRFHAKYDVDTGKPHGSASPYFDGEALLALVKAARYLGRDDLQDIVRSEADAGYQLNNVEARRKDPDSNTTKGYYQWSSMVYFELATSDWGNTRKYGDWLIELADWMIDTHKTLKKSRNTAYAYEGIVPAYEVAAKRGDRAHAEKFACTIEKGLAKITSWQIGHSLANEYIKEHPTTDPKAIGGIQNHKKEAPLRIDVTQHQMHAVILARRYYFTK